MVLASSVPLVGQIRLDDDAGAIAMRHHMRIRFDPLQESEIFQPCQDLLARGETVNAVQFLRELQ